MAAVDEVKVPADGSYAIKKSIQETAKPKTMTSMAADRFLAIKSSLVVAISHSS